MCEAGETCPGCVTVLTIIICIVGVAIIYIAIEAYTDGALGEWIGEWLENWIEKLPRPKNKD